LNKIINELVDKIRKLKWLIVDPIFGVVKNNLKHQNTFEIQK